MKIASLQYQYDFPKDFDAYGKKITQIVSHHAHEGVDLLVFPEYAGLEMLSFVAIEKLQDYLPLYTALFQELSNLHQIFICSGSQVVVTPQGTFNRSFLFSPNRAIGYQDKCMITPSETEEGIVAGSNRLCLFETPFGKIGICICYDIEFPPLAKRLIDAGARLLLVPSYTASVHGFYRVFLSCRARALENQCYIVQSALIGQTDIEMSYGASAICSPIDEGFPEDGLLAMGKRDQIESVQFDLDFQKLDRVRSSGQTHNFMDAKKLERKPIELEMAHL
jgi:predicted amidohydrolase